MSKFLVIDVSTSKVLQSEYTLFAALTAAGTCNAHEVCNGRRDVRYIVRTPEGVDIEVAIRSTDAYGYLKVAR